MIKQLFELLLKQNVPLILAVARRMVANLTSSATRVTRSRLVEMMEMESVFLELESRCHHMGRRTVISISK